MKRQRFSVIIPAVLIGMSAGLFSTKAMAQARWGFGAGPSVNSLYGDLKKTQFGIGGGGYLTRRFNSHLGLTGIVNYGKLPFTKPDTINKISNTLSPSALRGDLLLDYEISSGGFRPYVGFGVGGVKYKVTSKINGTTYEKSFTTFDFGPSLGFRLMLGSRFALDLGGSFRLTTSDNLDGTVSKKGKANDAIITGMLGFTIFGGGSRGTDIITEQPPVDETSTTDLDAFKERIDQIETNTPEQPQQDMQEYVRLKSKMDELNQQINQKDGEINTLRTAVAEKEQSVNAMQTQLASTPVNSASFSRGYEEALSKFYAKRYTEAIDQFNGIVAQFPDHPRVSNCVYWIGESHFGAGNYREAVNAFSRVLNYPRSLKRDDALLMLGRSYAQMNQKTEAREAFNRLLAEYPNSEFVAKAQEWLNRL